jgi:transcriptional regulator with XRE-family HTH domain
MDDRLIGRTLRVLRRRLGLRQVDVAARAGVSQQLVSRVELGRSSRLTARTLRRIFSVVDADVVTVVRWRGGALDRLLDEDHAAIVGRIAGLLQARGWQVLPEVTYSEWGERGSIDVLAWHAESRTLLVVEVKTEIASAEELLRRHDAKVRLAPGIGRDRFGAAPRHVGRLLVVAEGSTNRRRLARLESVIGVAYPDRGDDVRRWLRRPDRDLAGVLVVGAASGVTTNRSRVRRRVA